MKVCVGSPGRFHTFDLARQLARNGALQRLYTGYPRRKVDGLSPERVSTFPWLTMAAHGAVELLIFSVLFLRLLNEFSSKRALSYAAALFLLFTPGLALTFTKLLYVEKNVLLFFAAFLVVHLLFLTMLSKIQSCIIHIDSSLSKPRMTVRLVTCFSAQTVVEWLLRLPLRI